MLIAMQKIPFDIVGFDLDGTLLDTSLELSAALNHALTSVGRPTLATKDVLSLVGMGAVHMLRLGLTQSGECDDALVKRLTPVLVDYYEAHIGTNCPPFPGLIDALDTLASEGVTVAVVTNKFEHLAVKLLDTLGMSARFATIIGGDTMGKGRGKPMPDPILEMIQRCGGGRAAFVGDSIHDTNAARAAGIPSIAVSFGFLNQPIEELGANAVIDHYDELIPALHGLG
jgi:phosphoglycolate phosphatase